MWVIISEMTLIWNSWNRMSIPTEDCSTEGEIQWFPVNGQTTIFSRVILECPNILSRSAISSQILNLTRQPMRTNSPLLSTPPWTGITGTEGKSKSPAGTGIGGVRVAWLLGGVWWSGSTAWPFCKISWGGGTNALLTRKPSNLIDWTGSKVGWSALALEYSLIMPYNKGKIGQSCSS